VAALEDEALLPHVAEINPGRTSAGGAPASTSAFVPRT